MALPGTYSFKDTHATFSGDAGIISLGAGSANSEEGISIEQIEEKTSWDIGADGSVAMSLHGANAYRVTIHLLKTSPTNQQLAQAYQALKNNTISWARNTLKINNAVLQDNYDCSQVAFIKFPSNYYKKTAGNIDWEFICGKVDVTLGGAGLLIT